MELKILINPAEEDIQPIYEGLKAHNIPFIGEVPEQQAACVLYSTDGSTVGGTVARLWGSWLIIKYLWVDPSLQKTGMGTKLLRSLEDHAVSVGCTKALVDTLSFQARPFYEKHGYQCQMTLEDYPKDAQLHFLTKSLV